MAIVTYYPPQPQRGACKRRAFTLIELIVVLAIIAIIAGAIVPRICGSISAEQLRESAARLAHTAQTCRQLAAATGRDIAVEIDLDRGSYWATIQSDTEGSASRKTIQRSWLKPACLPTTVKITGYRTADMTTSTSGIRRLSFFPDGRSTGASIRLECDGRQYCVLVHPHNGKVFYRSADEGPLPTDRYDLGD